MFTLVQSELNKVTVFLEKNFRFKSGHLAQLIPEFKLSEIEKNFFPALELLSGKLFPGHDQDPRRIPMGGVIQMSFIAQEIHNKIPDDCPKAIPQFPVLVGDYLFALSFGKLHEYGLLDWLNRMADIICRMNEGGMLRRYLIEEGSPHEQDYLQVLEMEYGLLAGLACQVGGSLAGCTKEQEEDLSQFGRNIGMVWGLIREKYPLDTRNLLIKGREKLSSFPISEGREALLDLLDELEQMSFKTPLKSGCVIKALAT
ncbi:MAG: polyprenyl synthetase family protein [Dehalobacterium sp.]|jgi:hypothetical protein